MTAGSPREVDDGEDDDEDGDGEERQRDEAALRPLDLRAAHGLDELLTLDLRLRRLPVFGSAERREEENEKEKEKEEESSRRTFPSASRS